MKHIVVLVSNELLIKLHSSKFTLLLFQHNFLRVKSWKSGVIRSFHMKFRKKSGITQNQEKSGKSGSAWQTEKMTAILSIVWIYQAFMAWLMISMTLSYISAMIYTPNIYIKLKNTTNSSDMPLLLIYWKSTPREFHQMKNRNGD